MGKCCSSPIRLCKALFFVHRSQTRCFDVARRRFRAVCQGLAKDGLKFRQLAAGFGR